MNPTQKPLPTHVVDVPFLHPSARMSQKITVHIYTVNRPLWLWIGVQTHLIK
jgi:hypothetical protein